MICPFCNMEFKPRCVIQKKCNSDECRKAHIKSYNKEYSLLHKDTKKAYNKKYNSLSSKGK